MNPCVLFLAALVAVASGQQVHYHDDVFHFSSKVNPGDVSQYSQYKSAQPVYTQYKSVQPVYTQYKSVQPVYTQYKSVQPVYTQVQSVQPVYKQETVVVKSVPQYQQQYNVFKSVSSVPQYQQQQYNVYKPAELVRTIEQEVPAVSSVQTTTTHVHQPTVSQVSSAAVSSVPSVTFRSSAPVTQYNQYSNQYSHQYTVEPKYKIIKQVQEFDPSGIYKTDFQTENGISAVEQGTVKDIQAKEGPVAAKEGSYSYTGPDGVVYTVNWIADEFGYRAAGAHLPVAPPVPAEIQEALKQIAAQPQQQYDDNGNPIDKQL